VKLQAKTVNIRGALPKNSRSAVFTKVRWQNSLLLISLVASPAHSLDVYNVELQPPAITPATIPAATNAALLDSTKADTSAATPTPTAARAGTPTTTPSGATAAKFDTEQTPPAKSPKLEGQVSVKDKGIFQAQTLDAEVAEAVQKKNASVLRKAGLKGKSLANFVFDLRGFDWSKEGANAIADKNIDPKNEAAKEYLIRKKCDEQEIQKTALMMQMAMYMDNDPKKANQALLALGKVIGTPQAEGIYGAIKLLQGEDLNIEDSRLELDFDQKRTAVGRILEKTANTDFVLTDVSKRLSKYNHRSKFIQISAKVVYSGLGLATFTPTLVAPIAEAALLSFMMASGGPEQDKLLKEIYLGKIMQSRCNVLNEKAHMVVESMDMALLSKNKRLLATTKALIKDLTDDETATSMLGPFKNQTVSTVHGVPLDQP
jgi:hypothetical protein